MQINTRPSEVLQRRRAFRGTVYTVWRCSCVVRGLRYVYARLRVLMRNTAGVRRTDNLRERDGIPRENCDGARDPCGTPDGNRVVDLQCVVAAESA